MEKLFAALREKHHGCDVVDVRFSIHHGEVNGMPASSMDAALANAVKSAKQVDISALAVRK